MKEELMPAIHKSSMEPSLDKTSGCITAGLEGPCQGETEEQHESTRSEVSGAQLCKTGQVPRTKLTENHRTNHKTDILFL